MEIKKKIVLFNEFGPLVGFSSVCSSAIRYPMAITRWKDRCILRWMKEHYGDIIRKYKQKEFCSLNGENPVDPAPIWSVWWQGVENAPEMVKMCFASVNRHRGKHPFIIITKDNYQEYIDLPEYILKKVDSGVLRLTHFSDIIRLYLLTHYGGLWLDATIYVTDTIPEEIFSSKYYSIKPGFDPRSHSVTQGRWSSFFQAAQKGSLLCSFALDYQIAYWEKQMSLIDYVLIDYFYELAYEELPECRELLDSVPVNNQKVEGLRPLLNTVWSPSVLADLKADTTFFKLTWKHGFKKTVSGSETVYGHLVKDIVN